MMAVANFSGAWRLFSRRAKRMPSFPEPENHAWVENALRHKAAYLLMVKDPGEYLHG
ncbi:hypothetical protein HNP48_001977 [Acidovorax soli]|uniref:Uncharacterized protein n=1 Tax=Acidovorax soli TaxID=592050 RepID=A0A7X0PCE0_9BURK|nr:hypothetical protein [Acidovorax soli]